MRVALVSPYDLDRPGGVQNHVRDLSRELVSRGHTVAVFAPGQTGGLGRTVTLNVNGSQAPVGLGFDTVKRTRSTLSRFAPDIVHVHEPGVPLVGWTAVGQIGDAATVATCHAYTDTARLLPLVRPIGRALAKRVDRFIAVSDAAATFHARAFSVPKQAFTIIGNGIDLTRFPRHAPRSDQEICAAPRLTYLGRLEHRKGVDVLVAAFIALTKTFPHATLTIVGDGPQRAKLHAAIPAHLAPAVTFTGRVSDEERQQVLHQTDVLVAPARGGESFGIVLLEALASGCTLVATRIPGYASVVRDGIDGWLTTPNDAQALTGTLAEALTRADMRLTRRNNGFLRAETFGWPVVTDAIETVYRQALDAHRRR